MTEKPMNFAGIFRRNAARWRWLHAPLGLLVLLLQRTPVLRLALPAGPTAGVWVGDMVRSCFVAGALGAFDTLAGATSSTSSSVYFSVTNASPASGVSGTTFTVTSTVGVSLNTVITLTGSAINPRSWKINGTLPDGLTMVGGNPQNVSAPYNITIAGTPTKTGTWSLSVYAYQGADETGDYENIVCEFDINDDPVAAPVITSQPADALGITGGTVAFAATVTGNPPPTYQWYHDSQAIAWQTTNMLTLTDVKDSDAGTYTMTATNAAGTVTTTPVTLSVKSESVVPTISTQPQGATVTEGSPVSLSVVATGTFPLTYAWSKNGTGISGASSSTYALSAAEISDAGSYTVRVTNGYGTVVSNAVAVNVNPAEDAPVIRTQPEDVTITEGASASFSVVASGTSTLSYQWTKDGSAISGATSSSYVIPFAHASDAGTYAVTVTNTYGSAASSAATLTVDASGIAPIITAQPQSLTAAEGTSASFSVTATGSDSGSFTYQWMLDGTEIDGATGASYTLSSVQSTDAGSYSVTISNDYGSATSEAAVLTVGTPTVTPATAPVFSAQPVNGIVVSGHNLTLSAVTSDTTGVSYQWQISTDGGSTWSTLGDNSTYSGSQTSSLSISGATSSLSNSLYRLVATNATGSTTTSAVSLTVESAIFPSPSSLAVDSSGNLFVCDNSTNTIRFVTKAGVVSLLAGAAGQQGSTDGTYDGALFRQPSGIALDQSSNTYVADTGNSVIRKISPAGVVTTLAGSSDTQGYMDGTGTAAVFNAPQALVVNSSGYVYVVDTGNSVIRRVSPDGVVTTFAGYGMKGSLDGSVVQAKFNQPSGIALDSSGNFYVADTVNNTIRKISTDGQVTTWAGVEGVSGYADGEGTVALFNHPTGIVADQSDNIYVADTGNEIIRKISYDATSEVTTVETLAGFPMVAGLLDGNGLYAWFNQPMGLGIDSDGNLYVADNGNEVIRKVTPAGDVTTLSLTQTTSTPDIPSSSSSTSTGSSSTSSDTTTTSTSSGGGGGAPSLWFLFSLPVLWTLRRASRRKSSV